MTPIYRYCSQKTVLALRALAGRHDPRLPRWRDIDQCAADPKSWVVTNN